MEVFDTDNISDYPNLKTINCYNPKYIIPKIRDILSHTSLTKIVFDNYSEEFAKYGPLLVKKNGVPIRVKYGTYTENINGVEQYETVKNVSDIISVSDLLAMEKIVEYEKMSKISKKLTLQVPYSASANSFIEPLEYFDIKITMYRDRFWDVPYIKLYGTPKITECPKQKKIRFYVGKNRLTIHDMHEQYLKYLLIDHDEIF